MEYDMDIPSLRTAEIDANVAGGINSAKDEDVLDIWVLLDELKTELGFF